MALLC